MDMRDWKLLKRILESLAHQFTDFSKQITVDNGDEFTIISVDKVQVCSDVTKYLKTNLEEVHQLRILVDGLNKLVELLNAGCVPRRYYEFVKHHTKHPSTALVALTCVDSVYVDNIRLNKYPGLKKASLLHNYLLSSILPTIDSVESPLEQALLGLVHLTLVGYVRGIENVNQSVIDCLLQCKQLLSKAKVTSDPEERKKIAEELVNIISQLPGDESIKIHEQLPLPIPQVAKQLATNLVNANLIFEESSESDTSEDGSKSEGEQATNIPSELKPSTENFEVWCSASFSSNDVMKELLEISETERNLIQMIEDQLYELKLEIEKIEKFGDPRERDQLVNWKFKINIPDHIQHELYYLLYQLKTREKRVESCVGSYINLRNYIRFVSGDVNIQDRLFYDVEIKDVGNRAVLLLIDQSGSMQQGNKLELVRLATHILATAVTELGDKLAIFAFRGSEKCEITPILFWGERYREEYLSVLYPVGSTPLLEALIKAREWIKDVVAHEKLVIVLTDGEPTTSTPEQVREVVERIRSEGVKVIGLGIGLKIRPKQLRECFGESGYVWVPDLEDLPRELFRVYLQQYGVIL